VRQTAISADGNTVLAVCDEGTVWRWDFAEYKEFVHSVGLYKCVLLLLLLLLFSIFSAYQLNPVGP
jgi:hypothetical protein